MLATATEHSAKAGAPCATLGDAGEQRQRSFVAVGGPRDVRRLTTELRRHERRHAIVVLSLAGGSQQSIFPFGGIWMELAQPVPIYLLSTAYICRRFAEAVGSGLACRDGAARIYWPGVTAASGPDAHPLVLPQVDGDSRTPLERFVSAFELSRPSVRRHLAPIERRLHELQQQAAQQEQAPVKGRTAHDEAVARADAAESGLRAAQQTLDVLRSAGLDEAELEAVRNMTPEELLHRLIGREWLGALTAADREVHTLDGYRFAPEFLSTVQRFGRLVSLQRVAFACAMVACGRAGQLRGLDARHRRRHSNAPQEQRGDGGKAWICKVGEGGGAARLEYWVLPDHRIEFARLVTHDAAGRA